MTIYLIRHGTTAANEQHLYCGSSDLPLSPNGRQALQRHTAPKNVRFMTSGMKRTNETLHLLFGNVAYETESRLREIDFGRFEMQSYATLRTQPDYQAWITGDNEHNVPPGGESGAQMAQRVLAALEELLSDGQDTVVVTHGGVIAAIMSQLFPDSGKNRYAWQPTPGSGYCVTIENGSRRYSAWR